MFSERGADLRLEVRDIASDGNSILDQTGSEPPARADEELRNLAEASSTQPLIAWVRRD